MCSQALFCQFLVLGAWTAVVCVWPDADAAAWCEDACDLDVAWIHEFYQILHYDVDAILVKIPVIAEREEVQLQALALDHALVGYVADAYLGKVGLACDRAEGGEFGAVEAYPVVVLGMTVLECLKHLGGIVLTVLCIPA